MMMERLRQDLYEALKKGEKEKLSVLRLMISALSYEQIALQHELSEEEIMSVLCRQIKKRQESIELYRQGKREDLAQKEAREIEIIKAYLPEQMSEEKVRQRISFMVNNLPESEKKDFGKVMQRVMAELKDKADGATIARIVREITG